MSNIKFQKIEIGQKASIKKAFSETEIQLFVELSLDSNPVHLDEEFAKNSIFGKRIVHGFLYASLISGVIGTKLPGPGAIYLSQELKFLRPVYLDEEVTVEVVVIEKNEIKRTIGLETKCYKGDGVLVLSGLAKIKF